MPSTTSRKVEQSQRLQKRAESMIPGGVNSPVRAFRAVGCDPVFIVRGKGSHIWDADDNEYIDYIGSWGPLILGHADQDVLDAILGAAVGGGLLWVVSEAYFKLRGREGMGLGDVKMMLMAGAFLGAKRTLLTILAGSLLGSVLGVAIILARRKDADYELPFGTFLGAGALLVVFFGTPLVNWYQSLLMVR